MKFEVSFFGPFRVATGLAGRGSDITVDLGNLLPASSLKGLMRAAAKQVLAGRPDLVVEVFGEPRSPSAWAWSSAALADATVRRRARVAIDDTTGTAVAEALLFGEEVWADTATFSVDPLVYLDPERRRLHELVLLAGAHGVHALGGSRRRGLGWVGIQAADPVLDGDALDAIVTLAVAR
jgi:CRISPR/Cas system CSM-associated protein Csm3 (group 7 of RAMP superfamily)